MRTFSNSPKVDVWREVEARKGRWSSERRPDGLTAAETLSWLYHVEKSPWRDWERVPSRLRYEIQLFRAKATLESVADHRELIARHCLGMAEVELMYGTERHAKTLQERLEQYRDEKDAKRVRALWRKARFHYRNARLLGIVPGQDIPLYYAWKGW